MYQYIEFNHSTYMKICIIQINDQVERSNKDISQ